MKTIRLPNSYKKMYDEDMRKIVEGSNIVNIGKVIVAAAVGLIGIFAVSPFAIFENQDITLKTVFLKILLFFLILMIYMLLSESFRYMLMNNYGGSKPFYNYKFLYVYAGSNAYFNKKQYLLINLLPTVVMALILIILVLILPHRLFWYFYVLLIIDLAGGISDAYISWLVFRMDGDVFIKDTGDTLMAYCKREE